MTKHSSLSDLNVRAISEAATLLKKGELVVIPTETVYGLAADASNDQAVAKIFQLKQRPRFNPLIVHVGTLDEAQALAEFSSLALKLGTHFWPGPLTLVLPLKKGAPISQLATNGLSSVGIRIPAHPLIQALLKEIRIPLAAPSANKSTEMSPTHASDPVRSFGADCPFVLDGGDCVVGLESTILDLSEFEVTLLRPGGISLEDIEKITGPVKTADINHAIKAPGMMRRHYAPSKPLRLNAALKQEGEIFIGFGKVDGELNLSPAGDLVEAAANLFRLMRQADQMEGFQIAVAPIPKHGLGLAINDRLNRAATLS